MTEGRKLALTLLVLLAFGIVALTVELLKGRGRTAIGWIGLICMGLFGFGAASLIWVGLL